MSKKQSNHNAVKTKRKSPRPAHGPTYPLDCLCFDRGPKFNYTTLNLAEENLEVSSAVLVANWFGLAGGGLYLPPEELRRRRRRRRRRTGIGGVATPPSPSRAAELAGWAYFRPDKTNSAAAADAAVANIG